jgi:hypothetical protein
LIPLVCARQYGRNLASWRPETSGQIEAICAASAVDRLQFS